MIRAFIAIAIPDAVKASIGAAVTELRERNRGIRWVKPEGLHLTLKFLGDIPEETMPPFSVDLDKVSGVSRPLSFSLAGFGAFPDVKRPRVVWVGLDGDIAELATLAKSIDRVCAKYGIAEERRPFSGHITLGRLKIPTMVDLDIGAVTGMFMASEVLLYRSVLSPGGAQYTALHRSSLGG